MQSKEPQVIPWLSAEEANRLMKELKAKPAAAPAKDAAANPAYSSFTNGQAPARNDAPIPTVLKMATL
jgi:hypothetical protein